MGLVGFACGKFLCFAFLALANLALGICFGFNLGAFGALLSFNLFALGLLGGELQFEFSTLRGFLLVVCLARGFFLSHSCGAFRLCLGTLRSEEHTSELQSLMRISYAVFCLS